MTTRILFGDASFDMFTLVNLKTGIWDPADITPENDLVSHCLRRDLCWEPYQTEVTIELLEILPNKIFIDVGAHLGYYSLIAALYGWRAYAFEMNSLYYSFLERNISLNKMENAITPREIYIDSSTSIDCLVCELNDHIGLIKIDVEGSEPDVVKGMTMSLEKQLIDAVIIEISPKFLPVPVLMKMIADIQNHGYDIFDLGLSPARGLATRTNHLANLTPFDIKILESTSQTNLLFLRKGWKNISKTVVFQENIKPTHTK